MNDTLRATVFSAEDLGEAARVIVQVGEVVASTNLISSDLMAALSAGSSEALSPIEDNFKAAQARVKSNLDALVGIKGTKELKEAALQLLAIGDGKNSVFKVRQKEMDTVEYGELILDETRKLNVGLGMSVKQLVDKVRSETDAATTQAQTTITLATQVMLGLGALTLIGSALFVWLYVGRSILRRLAQLQRAMQRLSSGDLDTEIARSRQQDEIAAMAGTLEVFRDSMINARTLSAEQDQDRIAKGERIVAHRSPHRRLREQGAHRLGEAAELGRFHAIDRTEHDGYGRSFQRAGQRRRVGRRGNLGERPDGVGRDRATVVIDQRDQPTGRHVNRNRRKGRQRGPAKPM